MNKFSVVNNIVTDIEEELWRAVTKYPPMHSTHEGISVIREEFEELWDDVKADLGTTEAARQEAIQLGAMAVRYIYDLIDGRKS